jgi:hypothetical protein
MTKRQAKANRAAWNTAIREGRAVRFPELGSFKSYATPAEAAAAVSKAQVDGLRAEIIAPELAQ